MKKLLVLSLISVFLFGFSFRETKPFIIVLDAGHGGKDAGFVQDYQGISVKDIALNFTQRLIQLSTNYSDIKIISTRSSDEFLDLKERVKVTNSARPDLFISVHMDAYNNATKQGISLMFDESSKYKRESLAFAETIISQLNSDASVNIQSDVNDFDSYVLQNVDCPALLLNIGFLRNSADADYMSADDNIDALCKELIEALRKKE